MSEIDENPSIKIKEELDNAEIEEVYFEEHLEDEEEDENDEIPKKRNLTSEQRENRRIADKLRKRRSRQNMSQEQLEKRREQARERKRKIKFKVNL